MMFLETQSSGSKPIRTCRSINIKSEEPQVTKERGSSFQRKVKAEANRVFNPYPITQEDYLVLPVHQLPELQLALSCN